MRFGFGFDIAQPRSGGGAFSPASLFSAGEQGAFYDPSDLTTLFQDHLGTTPAAFGQPVGLMRDKSGRGNHASQPTEIKRPVLMQDAGGRAYLRFDGVDDAISAGAIDFTTSDEMLVVTGVRKLSDAAQAVVAELGASVGAVNGSFNLQAPAANGSAIWGGVSKGSTPVFFQTSASYAAPATAVLSLRLGISSDTVVLRAGGVQVAASGGDQGAGNFGNHPLHIGARAGASLFLNGHIYGLLIRGKLPTNAELTAAEKWAAGKTGVTL